MKVHDWFSSKRLEMGFKPPIREIRTDKIAEDATLQRELQKHIRQVNSQLASFESIKTFRILPQDFSVETGELTPSLKVKRKYCDEKFRAELDRMYGDG